MVRPEWAYAAAREQTLSDESGGRSGAEEVADEARHSQGERSSGELRTRLATTGEANGAVERSRLDERVGEMATKPKPPPYPKPPRPHTMPAIQHWFVGGALAGILSSNHRSRNIGI